MSADSASPEEGEFPQLSRALLTPGALPPLSHFGLTMMRHVVATGLRYALFQLGSEMPDGPPIRLVGLRLFLDRRPLEKLLAGSEAERHLMSALLQPAAAVEAPLPRRVSGAVTFHRLRMRLQRRPRLRPKQLRPGSTTAENRKILMEHLRKRTSVLGDAVLGELVSVLRRQAEPDRQPSLGPAARKAWGLGRADLSDLGMLDPLHSPWSRAARVEAEIGPPALKVSDTPSQFRKARQRGAFREVYRSVLTELAPIFEALCDGATTDGTLDQPTDLFFVPFPLLDELAIGQRPRWLDAAVATNRAERQRMLESAEHPEIMWRAPALEVGEVHDVADWAMAPLLPVP